MKSTTKQTLLLLSGIKATQLAEQINAIKVTDDKNTYEKAELQELDLVVEGLRYKKVINLLTGLRQIINIIELNEENCKEKV
jgi:hypothetical protein